MNSPNGLRAWAEVDLGALTHNLRTLRNLYADSEVMAIVKADAYGHGVDLVAPCAYANGVRHFGVATTDEAAYLRRLLRVDARVYLLSPVIPSDAPALVADRIVTVVSSLEMAEVLSTSAVAASTTADIHVDVDTGMGRSGFRLDEAADALAKIEAMPGLRLDGICTHFASADEDPDDARRQHKLFLDFLSTMGERASTLTVHASNSPATLAVGKPGYHTLVRPGLLMYGIEPAAGMLAPQPPIIEEQEALDLQPVLSIRARVTLCRELPAGSTISYGKTYTVPEDGGRYATVALGYGDGIQRALGNAGYVLIHGKRAPIRGRVCMDQFVVDVDGIDDVRAGDVATIVGRDVDEEITVLSVADLIGTTPHLISTCLMPRLPRLAVKG